MRAAPALGGSSRNSETRPGPLHQPVASRLTGQLPSGTGEARHGCFCPSSIHTSLASATFGTHEEGASIDPASPLGLTCCALTPPHPWEALLGFLGGAGSSHVAEKSGSRDLKARPLGSVVTRHLSRLNLSCHPPRPLCVIRRPSTPRSGSVCVNTATEAGAT